MGLAASQSRFLAITARKMNCEFQSMQIAQQKLSVTRDQQRASEAYQNALDATKLIWDADVDQVFELSYGLMMTPSELNGFTPYMITDLKGRVVLSTEMFNAVKDAGIIDENGNPIATLIDPATGNEVPFRPYMGELVYQAPPNDTKIDVDETLATAGEGSRNAFLREMSKRNQIDGGVVDSIVRLGEEGYNSSGIGGPIYERASANVMSTNIFINYLKEATYEDAAVIPQGKLLKDKLFELRILDALKDSSTVTAGDNFTDNSEKLDAAHKFVVMNNNNAQSPKAVESLTLGDILTGKYQLAYYDDDPKTKDYKDEFTKVVKAFAKELGYGRKAEGLDYKGLYINEQTSEALDEAYEFTIMLLNKTTDSTSNKAADLTKQAQTQNNVMKSKNGSTYAVSITNLLKSFLTYFVIALEGYDCGYQIDKESVDKSDYVTNDYTYNFMLSNDAAVTDSRFLYADFYNMLYNQIAMNGACTDEMIQELVTDNDYLEHALKNGQLFISSLNTDGYYYQGPYTLNGHVVEIKDEDAIARAELDYNVTKSKLNYKEETLELQMKNLDMEISALTTELDTVKNLISKNVEKVFTMFSS